MPYVRCKHWGGDVSILEIKPDDPDPNWLFKRERKINGF